MWERCTTCGKVAWRTRALARRERARIRALPPQPGKGRKGLHVYRCPARPWLWHVGHRPRALDDPDRNPYRPGRCPAVDDDGERCRLAWIHVDSPWPHQFGSTRPRT